MKAIFENLTSLEQELQFFNSLTDQQACEIYNVDYKNEAIEYIKDYWN